MEVMVGLQESLTISELTRSRLTTSGPGRKDFRVSGTRRRSRLDLWFRIDDIALLVDGGDTTAATGSVGRGRRQVGRRQLPGLDDLVELAA